jgi:hypothetical protein
MCVNPLISATLVFEIDETGPNWGPDGRVLTLHRMEQDWTEGNGWSAENKPAVRGDGPGATWMCSTDTNISDHQANCFSSWQMGKPQQDVHPWASTPTDSALVTSGQTGTLSFDVTEDVLAILAGDSPNYGWMLRKEAEGLSGWIRLHARESASPPVLILQVQ